MLFFTHLSQPCLLCLQPSAGVLCLRCQAACPQLGPHCHCCALPLAAEPLVADDLALCGECVQHERPFTLTVCPFLYRPPVDFILARFKQRAPLLLLEFLHQALLRQISASYAGDSLPKFLITTPSHWRKRLARGFNPPASLAAALAKTLGLAELAALKACRHRPAQKVLSKKARRRNIAGAFAVVAAAKPALARAHVALVDDVITTGATVTVLAELLLHAGAARVDIWALARTPKPSAL